MCVCVWGGTVCLTNKRIHCSSPPQHTVWLWVTVINGLGISARRWRYSSTVLGSALSELMVNRFPQWQKQGIHSGQRHAQKPTPGWAPPSTGKDTPESPCQAGPTLLSSLLTKDTVILRLPHEMNTLIRSEARDPTTSPKFHQLATKPSLPQPMRYCVSNCKTDQRWTI